MFDKGIINTFLLALKTAWVFLCFSSSLAVAVSASAEQNGDTIQTLAVTRTTTGQEITIAVENKTKKNVSIPKENEKNGLSSAKAQAGLLRIYRSNLLKKTYQYVVYPESAIDNNHEGDVVLKVIIDRNGNVKQVTFDSRANFNSLNKAATRALKKAKPFPAVPKQLQGNTFEILMPIRFRLTS